MKPATLSLALLLLAGPLALAADPPKDGKPKHTNRLAKESSPYLLQHAHNPVDWYPWGAEAFAKAKKEGKLVFLSIGYSSCHWCHVMEKESFADEATAKLMNECFVCIKVDREERPDIDHIYMSALHALGQQGGWPLSMWLTADAKPIVGGTYWPREDKEIDGEKVRGFKSLIKYIHEANKEKPKTIAEQADKLAAATAEALVGTGRGDALIDLERGLVDAAVDELKERHDTRYGGFGIKARNFKGTKFPTPPYLELLLQEASRTKSEALFKIVNRTLDRMGQGGIYDQLGGGFHRYSTERTWTVPHFEKMLYDNAQLVEAYSRAYVHTQKPSYKRIVQETLGFIERELTSPDGVFYSALDADSEGEEGRFYVWKPEEIDELVGNKGDGPLFKRVYGLHEGTNFEEKYHILVLPEPYEAIAKENNLTTEQLDQKLAPIRRRLLDVRGKRPRPFLDTKVLTGWNGQMIAGYAVAGQAFGDKKYIAAASKAADFLLKTMKTKDGRLLRTYAAPPGGKPEARIDAYLDDYAYLIHGLLCLHDATGDAKWLTEAKTLTDTMVRLFEDRQARFFFLIPERSRGGFFYTSNEHEKLFARSKDQFDGAQPSGNSLATLDLVRLGVKTKDARYLNLAEKNFRGFATTLKVEPTSMATLVVALGQYLDANKK